MRLHHFGLPTVFIAGLLAAVSLAGCGQLGRSAFPSSAKLPEKVLSPEETRQAIEELHRAKDRQQAEVASAIERR